ncbi:MAG: kinase/pyrophosphorylase [Anaerolineales bacterium]|nr:kinase/pyrophosphorylase [Anaerolineales bacterium]
MPPRSYPIFILSGGVGASGEQVVRTVLAQFPNADVTLRIFPKITQEQQVEELFTYAVEEGALVVHTFVDPQLRAVAEKLAIDCQVTTIDLFNPLIQHLTKHLDQQPQGTPGLYRQLHLSYFERIDAVNYSLAHDDGKNPDGWKEAEIILIGVSRVGKTPLSLYLSLLGWKVANIPLIPDRPLPEKLLEIDPRRVVGLTIDPTELLYHRKYRQENLGVSAKSDYTDPVKIYEEVDSIEKLIRRHGFRRLDVTNKPLETSADEIINLIRRQLQISGK